MVGAALFQAQEGDGLKHKLSVCNDVRYVYYQFAQLLQKAGMIMSNDYIIGLSRDSYYRFYSDK